MVLRSYRYRIYPTAEQKVFLGKHFGCCRFVYNYFLALRSEKWKAEQMHVSGFDCKKMLPELKGRYPWLSEVNSQSLQAAVLNLECAFRRFFKGLGKYPRFHSKRWRQAFSVPQSFVLADGVLGIPKLPSGIKVRQHRPLGGNPKTLTVIRESSGKYYISVVCECEMRVLSVCGDSVGVDLGLRDFAVLSTGERIGHPKWFRQAEGRLARLQRRLSRRRRGSVNRERARRAVAVLHERIRNRRGDFLHKLSRRLIGENQVVSVEGLRVRNMVRNRHLAKAIGDSGWAELVRQLQYKAEWFGRMVKVIDTFNPSSKTCSACGAVNRTLKLGERVWQCKGCFAVHDRDCNAAVNIEVVGRDTPEVTPVERRAAAVLTLSMRQVRSVKQEALVFQ